ncbi:MAG: molybdopterin molybdotransferase MoeA [Deltaproteobacteria bacterium]
MSEAPIPVEVALERVLAGALPLGAESVPLDDWQGRALARELLAPSPLPRFSSSAMDGYAVRAGELAEASPERPVALPIAFEVAAGAGPSATLPLATCARIYTGAPLPEGADAVVMQEVVRREGDRAVFTATCAQGQHVRPRGEDVASGAVALPAGARLGPAEISLAVSLGVAELWLHHRPRVAILTTGDELHGPGEPLSHSGIHDSNGPALAAAAREAGATVVQSLREKDDPRAIRAALARCQGADLVLSVAGISVGERDFVREALASLGARLDFWRVAMRPGKPLAFGRLGPLPILCLPGNPVSCLVTFELFGRPLVRRLAGHLGPGRTFVTAGLTQPIHKPPELALFCRGRSDGTIFTPAEKQGSGLLTSLVGQNAIAELPPGPSELPAGSRVRVRLLRADE